MIRSWSVGINLYDALGARAFLEHLMSDCTTESITPDMVPLDNGPLFTAAYADQTTALNAWADDPATREKMELLLSELGLCNVSIDEDAGGMDIAATDHGFQITLDLNNGGAYIVGGYNVHYDENLSFDVSANGDGSVINIDSIHGVKVDYAGEHDVSSFQLSQNGGNAKVNLPLWQSIELDNQMLGFTDTPYRLAGEMLSEAQLIDDYFADDK